MRLEWLDDILAVFETGSLNQAALRRRLSQPAFSRRIGAIEGYLGVELLDRTRKPAQLRQAVREREGQIRELAAGLRQLAHELRQHDRQTHNRIVIACLHAITTSVAPGLVKKLSSVMDLSIRLRSANSDECLSLLFSRQADLTLTYRSLGEATQRGEDYLQEIVVGRELLVPVLGTSALPLFKDCFSRGELPIVAYPADVYLGQVMAQDLYPRIAGATAIFQKAETALTLAALHLALAGVGVAWVPRSLALNELGTGRLVDLRPDLPYGELAIVATRLAGEKSPVEQRVWNEVTTVTQD